MPAYQLLLLNDESTYLQRILTAYADPDSTHIFIAAHRGGRENDFLDQAPGNSTANILNAVTKGFDIYESDIEVLGDGTLVVFHDNRFDELTNSQVANDLLDDATLAYAKSLRLTYSNDQVSDHQIPTLEEFLSAGKGKIMFKFDLKSGTYSRITDILDTVIATDTAQQVLIRVGMSALDEAKNKGYDTRMLMPRINDMNATASDINNLTANYLLRAISLPNGAQLSAVNAARASALVVEIHESQNPLNLQMSWQQAMTDGYRQIHSFKPLQLINYLKGINRHW